MTPTPPLGTFSNLMGWDGVLILGIQALVFVGIVLLVRFVVRQNAATRSGKAPESRLRQLDSMRGTGAITDAEYQEQRQRILSEM